MMGVVQVTLLYLDGCQGSDVARDRLIAATRLVGLDEAVISYQRVDNLNDAQRWGFTGSPTILVDGHDPFAPADPRIALACRVYQTDAGGDQAPSVAELVAALRDRHHVTGVG
jgi:hypothetical protein